MLTIYKIFASWRPRVFALIPIGYAYIVVMGWLKKTNFRDYLSILGPDNISIRDCIDLVDNTKDICLLLVSFAPIRVQSTLAFTINKLSNEARKCCLAGGLWKGCFQKLGDKFHQWNQKWQVFRIPPDPAWD